MTDAQGSSSGVVTLLAARIDALFPDGEHRPPAVQLRRAIALLLASNPRPEVGEFACLLTTLGAYLRQSQAHLWLDPDQRWPKLKAFLEDADSQGAFRVQEVQDVAVRLDLRVLLPPAPAAAPQPAASASPTFTTTSSIVLPRPQLRHAIHTAFRTTTTSSGRPRDPGEMLCRHLGLWLMTSPCTDKLPDTPYAALLSDVGSYLATASSPASELWCDRAYSWPKLREFLKAPERGGCFRVVLRQGHTGDDLVQLDVEAVKARAAAAVAAQTGGSSSDTATTGAPSGNGATAADSKLARDLVRTAFPAAEKTPASGGNGGSAAPLCDLVRMAFPSGEKAEDGGWRRVTDPGHLLRRAIALWLADGPARHVGPHHALTSWVGDMLREEPQAGEWAAVRAAYPKLKDFLSAPESGQVFKVGFASGYSDNVVSLDEEALRRLAAQRKAGSCPATANATSSRTAVAAGAAVASSAAGGQQLAAAADEAEALLAALFPQSSSNGAAAAAGGGRGGGADVDADPSVMALRCVARLLLRTPPPHKLLFAKLGSQVPLLLGRASPGLRQLCSLRTDVFELGYEGKSNGAATVRLVCPHLLRHATRYSSRGSHRQQQAEPPPQRNGGGAAVVPNGRGLNPAAAGAPPSSGAVVPPTAGPAGVGIAPSDASVAELIRAAFPLWLPDGRPPPDHAARRLRQAIAIWLVASPDVAGTLGPRRSTMSMLGHYLRLQQAALWMNPAHKFPRLRPFLESADSRGVFVVRGKPGDSEPIVELDAVGLRQAAAAAAAEERMLPSSRGAVVAFDAAAPPIPSSGLQTDPSHYDVMGPSANAAAAADASPRANATASAVSLDDAAGPQPQQPLEQTSCVPEARNPAHAAVAAAGIAAVAEEPAQQHLPDAGVCVVADPHGEQLIAMLQHCGCCTRIGLAVQAHAGRPTLVSLYAPPALMQLEGPEGQLVQWPAAVYLVDPLAAAAAYGGGADGDMAAAALLCSLQALLEAPSVAKVVHGGGGGLACLEAAIDAFRNGGGSDGAVTAVACVCAYPVHDTRLLLACVECMLGLPHTPPAPSPQPNGTPPGAYMPGAPYGGEGVALLRGLHGHVARLRDALAGTGLWADRPQLLAALTARHFAALREDMQAAIGSADVNECAAVPESLTRPLAPSQVEVAARCARHLPELWAALVQEAVPWVALHVSTAAMAGCRLQQQDEAAAVMAPQGTNKGSLSALAATSLQVAEAPWGAYE